MTKPKEPEICPYCKNEVRPLDNHVTRITADTPSDKHFIKVACTLERYYHIEPIDQK